MSRKYIKNCTGDKCASSTEKNKANRLIARIVFFMLLFTFLCATIYTLFFSQQMQIVKIELVGTQELNSDEVQQRVLSFIDGKYLSFIPKNNFLFISEIKIANYLSNNYKKIRNVNVQKKFPDTLSINIDERKALLVWCKNEQECYLLDENGVAYSVADFNSQELIQNNLLRINDNSQSEISIGSGVISPQYEKYLLSIKEQMKKIGVDIVDQFSTPSRMSEEIVANTSQGWNIYFSTQFMLDSATKSLSVLLKKELSGQQENLLYVDLRNENKVFYKMK